MTVDWANREKSFELYRKGKVEGTWDPDDFEYDQDVEDWQVFTEEEQARFLASCAGFYDGEEDVTRTLAPYLVVLDRLDEDWVTFNPVQEEMYLAQQLYEEAKHTDFFSRYYDEVFGHQDTETYGAGGYQEDGYSTEDLYDTADALLKAAHGGDETELVYALGEGYLNYMGIVEAQLARGGYMGFDQMSDIKAKELQRSIVLPGFQEAVSKIRQDETRHIENGRWVLQQLAESHPEIVADVYEPRLLEYVENRVVGGRNLDENPFEGYDPERIGKRTVLHLQDTVNYIGAEKFDRLTDVTTTVETMRSEGEGAAAAGDD